MNTLRSGIVSMFMGHLPLDVESVIDKKLKDYADDESMIKYLIIPYNKLRIIGSHGVNGSTYGYFDVVFHKGGTIKDWTLIGGTSAYEIAKRYYDEEYWI